MNRNYFKSFLNFFNYKIVKIDEYYQKKIDLYFNLLKSNYSQINEDIVAIVFSMDRALQLDALLRSFLLNKNGDCKLIVLYKASDDRHRKAYLDLLGIYGNEFSFIEQNNSFKLSLLSILKSLNQDKLFFLVDDIVITENIDFNLLSKTDTTKEIFSLRMGLNLNYSYVVKKQQELPAFNIESDEYLTWNWRNGNYDWGYPLSVDGHVFSKNEILLLAEFFEYNAPNSFESVLQEELSLFSHKVGRSYMKSRIVNNPCNKVQNEVSNFHGSLHQDDLLKIWNAGMQIDISYFQGIVNKSVHEEIPLNFISR
jgi:hypothetical protein